MTLAEALLDQALTTESFGSTFTTQLLRLLADRLAPGTPIADRLLTWEGDITNRAQSVPLRIAGALHGLVLDGTDPGLIAVYPPNTPSDDALWGAVSSAFVRHEARLQNWLDLPPQTNEVRRSAALIAAAAFTATHSKPVLDLLELGASAGLNLTFDRYSLTAGDAQLGAADPVITLEPEMRGTLPEPQAFQVASRRGVDLNPLDPLDAQDRLRLLAYIWPDQTERFVRTRAAIEIAEPVVDKGDAGPWVAAQLAKPAQLGHCRFIYSTVAWQYFPDDVKTACTSSIETAAALATPETPLAWFGMEDDTQSPGAGLTLRLWPGNRRFDLGRIDFHGRWLDWTPKETT